LGAGRRLHSVALIADGHHARADAYVSLAVIASAVVVALGAPIADPLIGLGITLVILRITWRSLGLGARRKPALALAPWQTHQVLTAFGVTVLTFMMVMYACERRGHGFILAFACGCLLSSVYGFLAGTWPFGVVEAIWAVIAVQRYRDVRVASGRRHGV